MSIIEKSVDSNQSADIETLENELVDQSSVTQKEIHSAGATKTISITKPQQPLRILGVSIHSLRNALIIAKKELQILLRYPGEIVVWILMPMIWLVPFIFQGQALLGPALQSDSLKQYTGSADVISFIFIGALLWNILDGALWGAGNTLRWEQHSGTLQFLWLSPISRIDLLIGASLSTTVWSMINITTQFAILSIFVSWQVTLWDVILTLVVLILVIIGLYGFSFAFAAIILVFKEPGALTELVDNTLYICSPIRYPIEILPNWIKWIAWITPFTWGLTAIRFLLLTNGTIVGMLYMIGILIGIDVIFWIIGYFLFHLAEKRTMKTGALGTF
ncbi:MAG: hypothetical protein GF308_11075 [Candidatus Heimdallarchaeota archaeon]|nr:hypothetical protein [Candidatus Heimdallarchaeota archaeon]